VSKLITRSNFDHTKLTVEKVNIEIPNLSPEFDRYRIVQLSDFHLGTLLAGSHLSTIIERTNSLEPDLIAITGDLVSFNAEKYASVLVESLSKLSAPSGVFSVLGNHDHWTDAAVVRRIYKDSHIIELHNEAHLIQRNSAQLYIAGIDDYRSQMDDLNGVLTALPANVPAILLAHEPDFAEISSRSGRFALQISGHSHGGQILLPLIGSLFLPRYGRKYPSGMYRINGMLLYTNRGLGTSWINIRYNCPSEITIFELSVPEN
jgi:predicted MPP superfamily phosphohydrolase